MKTMIVFLATLWIVCASAGEIPGNQIEFFKVDGKPRFGVQVFSNKLAMTFSINGLDLVKDRTPVTAVSAQFVNKSSGEALTQPIQLRSSPNGTVLIGTQAFALSVEEPVAQTVIDGLSTSAIVLTTVDTNGGSHSAYIDIAAYCVSAPGHFLDLETGENGCK